MIDVVDAVRYVDPELGAGLWARRVSWPDAMTRICARLDADGVRAAGIVLEDDQLVDDALYQADRALAATNGRAFGWYGVSPQRLREVGRLRGLANLRAFRGAHVAPYRGRLPVDQADYFALYATCQDMGLPLALEVGSAPARSGSCSVALPDLLDTVAFAFPDLRLLCVNRGRLWLPTLVRWARVHKNFNLGVGDDVGRDWDQSLLESITHPVDYWHPDGARKVAWCSAVSSSPPARLIEQLSTVKALTGDQVARVMGLNAGTIVGLASPPPGAEDIRGLQ